VSVRRLHPVQPDSFAFNAENLAWAKEKIAQYPAGKQASAVIPLLWRAQEQNDNWVTKPVIEYIAHMLDMAYIRVLEVATFYTMFQLQPAALRIVRAEVEERSINAVKIGQKVEIKADALGKTVIKGRIDSFSPATGAEFALIPVENAVGNFTKIAQRVPVRVAVDRDAPLAGALRPGLSVEVRVDVRDRAGVSFAQSGAAPTRYVRTGQSQ
jgi:hypothetical protein